MVIRVDRLSKRYGDITAVEDVSFTVERGEIFGILGMNGAGKTTIVECLQGLRRRDEGEVSVLGLDPQHQLTELRRRIGSQLQESGLPDRLTVQDALSLFACIAGRGTAWRELMSDWGLAEKAKKPFASLSGGEKQRLFVALALVNEPEVVFLDEMTQGLDPSARRIAWRLIRRLKERGATVVLVSHYMDEVEQLCDRLIVIDSGKIAAAGTPAQVVGFTGEANLEDAFLAITGIAELEDV